MVAKCHVRMSCSAHVIAIIRYLCRCVSMRCDAVQICRSHPRSGYIFQPNFRISPSISTLRLRRSGAECAVLPTSAPSMDFHISSLDHFVCGLAYQHFTRTHVALAQSGAGKDAKCTSDTTCKMPLAQWSVRQFKQNTISPARCTNTQICLNVFAVSFARQKPQPICHPSFG